MGCGSGIVSIFAASKGARCVAADINPMAVKSALKNAEANGFKDKIEAVESDLFESLVSSAPLSLRRGAGGEGQFDFIFFNPPYYKGSPKNNFERAFKGGENLDVISRFAEESKKFLKGNGIIYMIISSDTDINFVQSTFESTGFTAEIDLKIKKFFETFYIIKIVL